MGILCRWNPRHSSVKEEWVWIPGLIARISCWVWYAGSCASQLSGLVATFLGSRTISLAHQKRFANSSSIQTEQSPRNVSGLKKGECCPFINFAGLKKESGIVWHEVDISLGLAATRFPVKRKWRSHPGGKVSEVKCSHVLRIVVCGSEL